MRRISAPVALLAAVVLLAAIAAIVLLAICVHELQYASRHPHRPGFANVIAWGAGAATLLAVAIGALAVGVARLARSAHS